MSEKYIKYIIKMFPHIASGRKNFKYFEFRIRQNIKLTHQYIKKNHTLVKK